MVITTRPKFDIEKSIMIYLLNKCKGCAQKLPTIRKYNDNEVMHINERGEYSDCWLDKCERKHLIELRKLS